MAQIDAALYAQGSGAAGGYRGSINGANLAISGSSNITFSMGNALLVWEGFVYGIKRFGYGVVGWVSSLSIGAGGVPGQAALTLG